MPTLVLEDGAILTESGAITLWLGDQPGGERLVPRAGSPERARFLRLLFFINSEIYPCFTFADDPAEWVSDEGARQELKSSIGHHHHELWRQFDRWIGESGGPWVLGATFSALDVYCAVMAHWRPRRPWFRQHCPRIEAIVERVWREPHLVAVRGRHIAASE